MEVLQVKELDQTIKYSVSFNLFNIELSEILKKTLEVDEEFSKKIQRVFEVSKEGNLNLSYTTSVVNLKPMKKSINGMLENMSLVLETVLNFSPNSIDNDNSIYL